MVHIAKLLSAIALLGLVGASPYGEEQSSDRGQAKAIYLLTNDASNAVIALKVNRDGTLSQGSITPTGGKGANEINVMTGMPAGPDALSSQSALTIAGSSLVAVNAGSNTLSMFKIDERDATKLVMVGQPVSTMGDFPVTVAASESLRQACVANTGPNAGIACFKLSRNGLIPLDKKLRSFDLGQSNPPVGPFNSVAHTFFNQDSTALLTTVKGDPTKNITGFLSVYPVTNGKVADQDVRTSPKGTAVLFGSATIPRSSNVVVTDASFGVAVFRVSKDGTVSIIAETHIAGQAATCWAIFSPATKSAYVADAGMNRLVEIDPADGSILQILNPSNDNPGMIDMTAAGDFVYALSPASQNVSAAIAVFDVSGGRGKAKEIQNFQPGPPVGINAQGLTHL